jgi:hypothetical protein
MHIVSTKGSRSIRTIFFLSSCFFATGWISQLALDIFYPIPLSVLNAFRPSSSALVLGVAFFGTVSVGLMLFIFGVVRLLIHARSLGEQEQAV